MKCMLCGTENRAEANNCKGCGALIAPRDSGIPPRKIAPTVFENNSAPAASSSKTRIVPPEEFGSQSHAISAAPSDAKKTKYVAPNSGSSPAAGSASGLGPVAGFLISYSWDSAGHWFPVREGRTNVGSDASCDAHLRNDKAMSGKHFAIMVRQGAVRVRDLESTNATFVDGKEVWSDVLPAYHGSIIKAGDTEFILVLIPRGSEKGSSAESTGLEDEK